ncbi:SAV_2336 N-terminal domain-related protein [Actinacidiphila bryophytorum]|uniref:Tubulin-like protein n=1 Tax=Actinacidiphila bryophytorum TaxID=1436133 RepID=A0A9W4GYV4_9ACTN|nr:SAV_2336 N-terminal domain-related protein [Actinacidiphila bryophytorum]MBM9437990.1 hypothetical protein [Actinacidiphila bryophytorum]MBN6545458.1 hypothetical protein [Actinacidiphila bryophytorum]CAG7617674.1 Tubulin-like protein [Actinacidiphila bryophytorum]
MDEEPRSGQPPAQEGDFDGLERSLGRLLDGPGGASAADLADLLWVARFAGRSLAPQAPDGAAEPAGPPAEPEPPQAAAPGLVGDPAREAPAPVVPPAGGDGPVGVPLHAVSAAAQGEPDPVGSRLGGTPKSTPARVVPVPREGALHDRLAISRALRPLRRRVGAPGPLRLDEEATARASGEASLLSPAWLPHTESLFSVDLVVDSGPSMAVWQQLAAEMHSLLGQSAFRMTRVWSLDSATQVPRLAAFPRMPRAGARTFSLDQLRDPSGRRIVLLLTDGVGPLWRNAALHAAITRWSRAQPVAVLQVLPQRLWHRTALVPSRVLARPPAAGRTVPRFRQETLSGGAGGPRHGGWVPMLELRADWIAPWAGLLAGTAPGWTPLLAFPTGGELPALAAAAPGPAAGHAPAAADLVERFRGEASPEAFELAGYLSAVPLVLPVIRLVQRVMLPASTGAHLAEFFLSGLLLEEQQDPHPPAYESAHGRARAGVHDDLRMYDLLPGVRDALMGTLTRRETLRVLDVLGRVSGRVAERFGGSLNFRALVPAADAQGDWRLPEGSLPFARIAATALAGLGGEYRRMAAALTAGLAREGTAAGPVSSTPAVPQPPLPPPVSVRQLPTVQGRVLSQPMMFVGLGGTGVAIGAEVERRLRDELCGPDGRALSGSRGRLPYQLPDCVQFVYADLDQGSLADLPLVTPGTVPRGAYASTSRISPDSFPEDSDSSDTTRRLRRLPDADLRWLPPADDEPRVLPLTRGSGQLPTVARASLFSTMQQSPTAVAEALGAAVDAIARSAAELREIGGGHITGCDVFVAFSVAGGTGAGLFVDYLHLIGEEFAKRRFPGLRIHPLVVMPSAFPPQAGGGREAELNGARALLDLADLVDWQNAPASDDLDDDPEQLTIRHPGGHPLRMRVGTMPTAFLLGRPPGGTSADVRRSAVSLVMSLIGGEAPDDAYDTWRTFADSFLDNGVRHAAPSPSGLGRRGLTTSVSASLSIPVEALADLMTERLMGEAFRELSTPSAESTPALVRRLIADSGLDRLREAPVPPVRRPAEVRGTAAVVQALRDREDEMRERLSLLADSVGREVPELADRFDPRLAVALLLERTDPFSALAAFGNFPERGVSLAEGTFLGWLVRSSLERNPPRHLPDEAPTIPAMRGRLAGAVRVRWTDPEVRALLRAQDEWYVRRGREIWWEEWAGQGRRWLLKAQTAAADLGRLVAPLRDRAETSNVEVYRRIAALYQDQATAHVRLLPPQERLDSFFADLLESLAEHEGLTTGPDGRVRPVLSGLLAGGWREALRANRQHPDAAVAEARAALRSTVDSHLLRSDLGPVLPPMSRILAAAAGDNEARADVSEECLGAFTHQVAGLLAPGYVAEGNGPLRIIVTYPGRMSRAAEDYLLRALTLPRTGDAPVVQFVSGHEDTLSVVMVRSGMGITQVPEARDLLRLWTSAQYSPQPSDVLPWRQRLGYRDGWLLGSEHDRRRVLHRILVSLWNGIGVDARGHSPRRVRIPLGPESEAGVRRADTRAALTLSLPDSPAGLSTWPGVLGAYERWAITEDPQLTEPYAEALMSAVPAGGQTIRPPDWEFVRLVTEIAPRQTALLEQMREAPGGAEDPTLARHWEFWTSLLPAAMRLPCPGVRGEPTLDHLLSSIR